MPGRYGKRLSAGRLMRCIMAGDVRFHGRAATQCRTWFRTRRGLARDRSQRQPQHLRARCADACPRPARRQPRPGPPDGREHPQQRPGDRLVGPPRAGRALLGAARQRRSDDGAPRALLSARPQQVPDRAVPKLMAKLLLGAIALLLFLAGSAQAATLQPIGSFDEPVFVSSSPTEPNRLFVAERDGRVMQVRNGVVSTFADARAAVDCCVGDRGMNSIAVAPDFASSGRIYLDYSDAAGNIVIAE